MGHRETEAVLPDVVRLKRVAAELDHHEKTLIRWHEQYDFPAFKRGKFWYAKVSEVRSWFADGPPPSTPNRRGPRGPKGPHDFAKTRARALNRSPRVRAVDVDARARERA